MAATIQYYQDRATIDGYEWTGTRASLVEWLNAQLPLGGPSGDDPNPDYNEALRIAELLPGAEVVSFDEMAFDPGVVY
jgi:hypothetical protein